MKYILISLSAILIAVSISILIVLLINKKHKMKGWLKAIIIPISSLLLIFLFVLSYFAFNYPATDKARSYLKGDDEVNVIVSAHWYHLITKLMMTPRSSFIAGPKLIQWLILRYVVKSLIAEWMFIL